MGKSRLCVIILNWNGTSDTVECLASIASTEGVDLGLDVIVVDNGSEIDPTAEIRSAYPQATVIGLERNVGFAAGCNFGIKEAIAKGADCIVLLNNDTIVNRGLFEEVTRAFHESSDIGIVGPLIYQSDGRQIDFAGAKIDFALGKFEHLRDLPEKNQRFYETDYVSGCCMMLSRAAIERVGLLDENLFAYFEDVDLCLRARRAGFRLTWIPTASIIHKGSASTTRTLTEGTISPLKHYLIARNRTVIVNRHAPPAAKWFYLLVSNPLRVCFYSAAFVVRGRWSKLRWFWRGVLDGLKDKLEMPSNLS
jgi:GT2 family glycosyltransferase